MIARVIGKVSSTFYKYPKVSNPSGWDGPFGNLKVALITDHFTEDCLSVECRIKNVTPQNYREVFESWKPDLLFVESVFHGAGGAWRYELARQPKWMRLTKPKAIYKVVDFARACGIPTVFWNKDDGAFFGAFIDVAKHFDHVLTTDSECLPKYRAQLPAEATVNVMMMPYQPAFHDFTGFAFERNEACFTGSYYRQILDARRSFLDAIFQASGEAGVVVNVYDRNHDRFSRYFEFRFPRDGSLKIHPRVAHRETANVYKKHALSINVNSVTDSETMCSRRLLEILACGGIMLTNPSRCVDKYFRNYCHVASTPEEMCELLSRLKFGPSQEDLERAEAGARYVRAEHTWTHRLGELCAIVNI
jgi:spore maturation protein CgeB